jgi:hypothetical protein
MLKLNAATPKILNIITKDQTPVLDAVLKKLDPKELATLNKQHDLPSLLSSLLKQNYDNSKQNRALLNILQNNPTLKELQKFTPTLIKLQNLLTTKTDSTNLSKLQDQVDRILNNINTPDGKELKSKIEESGLFLESKLNKATPKDLHHIFKNDLKALLLSAKQELSKNPTPHHKALLQQIDKAILQIDYYQLLSYTTQSSVVYIPYNFDALKEGQIKLHKKQKNHFLCDIELNLKNYGKISLRLGLFEKNQLNINIQCQSKSLEIKFKEALPKLKKALLSKKIYPNNITFLENKQDRTNPYQNSSEIDLGFEVKG